MVIVKDRMILKSKISLCADAFCKESAHFKMDTEYISS